MPKHAITETHVDFDHEGNAVYILKCKCGWATESYNKKTLVVIYQQHVVTERKKGN